MPITSEQNIKILGYAQAGFSAQEILATMIRIGEPVSKLAFYRHLARMRRNGEWVKWEREEGQLRFYNL
jgi:Fe2+ or Zn2+ uptake regulation protein